MLHDLQAGERGGEFRLFWNTYNAQALPVNADRPSELGNIPAEFGRYYEVD